MAKTRSNAELATAVILLLFSVIYTLSSLHLKIGRLSNPGPGLMPLLLGLGLSSCALAYIIQQVRLPSPCKASPDQDVGRWRMHLNSLCIVLPVAAYPFLLAWLGFLIATFIVVYSILLLLKFRTPWQSLPICIAMTICCYILFARLLGVVLPVGPAEDFLFRWF